MDYKKSVLRAMERYNDKQLKKSNPRKKRNGSPESDFIKNELMPWLRENHFDVNIIEAKATYSEEKQRYLSQAVSPGFSDICGNDQFGTAVFIEAKAPGKKTTVRPDQLDFLRRKIKTGCFAMVVDDIRELDLVYTHWQSILEQQVASDYLLSLLPRKTSAKDDGPLF